MAITAQTPYNSYSGNGSTTVFPYTFKVFTASDMKVYLDGVLTTAYTISGVGVDGGGNITFTSAPASGVVVLANREIPYDREVDYQTSGDLLADTLDNDIDRVVCQVQQLSALNGVTLQSTLPLASYDAHGREIINLGSPTDGSSAVNKTYLDAALAGYPDNPTFITSTVYITADTTISDAIIVLPGGNYDVATGVTLTINGPFQCGLFQCFDGDGSVVFGSGSVSEVYPEWWSAIGDGTTDDSAAINKALAAGFKKVTGSAVFYLINSSLVVPSGVEVEMNLTAGTAGMNMVLVNTGSKFKGKLVGTGTTNTTERGIYPAADGVTDVVIDVEVSNLTVGVQAQYITTYSAVNVPKRWSGSVYAHNIVGAVGVSEGYGLLLSPAENCNFNVIGKDVARHGVYLSSGARHNKVHLDIDGCNNYAVQLYSTSVQEATEYNTITVKAKNLGENVARQSGAAAIIQKANYNTVIIDHIGNNATDNSVLVEGSSGGPYPLSNKVVDGAITGQFTGTDVIKLLNADSTLVTRNILHAYATNRVIGMLRSGTNGSTHGGFVFDNDINAQGQSIRGIYDECNAQPSYIGPNNIRNNGVGLRVDDQTGGKRQGFSRKLYVTGTTNIINAGVTGDITVSLPDDLQTTRHASVTLTGASVQFFNAVLSCIGTISTLVANQHGLRFYNGHGAAQTLDYEAVIEGD